MHCTWGNVVKMACHPALLIAAISESRALHSQMEGMMFRAFHRFEELLEKGSAPTVLEWC